MNAIDRGRHFLRPLLAAALYGVLVGCVPPDLPENPPITETRWLDQNWSEAERRGYHHASQGTSTLPVPYSWFMALEQPRFWFTGEPPLLSDTDYLARFGFIPQDDPATARKVDGLPVGFALTSGSNPVNGERLPDQIGFTCAACHTGQLEYQGTSLRIDGAPAMVDLGKFREALGVALGYTSLIPGRFDRFADRVLGDKRTDKAEREQLRKQLDALITEGKKLKEGTAELDTHAVEEGFGRLDALNRIGNQMFYTNLRRREDFHAFRSNYATTDAPVSFPPLWDTPWFDWVQYDGSIMQPMVRNAGEALGVKARVNVDRPGDRLFASLVNVEQIHRMERQLRGDDPRAAPVGFKGLRAPVWPADVLGPIDQAKREQGRKLYKEHCEGCHRPAVDDPADRFWDDKYWIALGDNGQRYLKLKLIDLEEIGTDPAQAKILRERLIKLPAGLGLTPGTLCGGNDPTVVDELYFGPALAAITEKVIDARYDALGITDEATRRAMNGDRPNCLQDKPPGYKARPLDGIWATPPYLHNGSVPNLYALLSPVEERPKRFCVGSRAFDPVHVGYDSTIGLFRTCPIGLFKLDTTVPGNGNGGHEFADKPEGNGVIGPKLSKEERFALIEFLKSTPAE